MLTPASRIVSEKSRVSEVVELSSITIESGTWKKLAPPAPVNASRRCTTFDGPVGIFVTETCYEPAAVQLAMGEGTVQNPWRVTNTTTHSCTPGEIFPVSVESASAGASPGPTWLTRSKKVSSNWRGRSAPTRPFENAMYSRPKCVVEAKSRFG